MRRKIIPTLLICSSFSYLTFAQKVGIQFYQGVNKPMISFSGENNALDYIYKDGAKLTSNASEIELVSTTKTKMIYP